MIIPNTLYNEWKKAKPHLTKLPLLFSVVEGSKHFFVNNLITTVLLPTSEHLLPINVVLALTSTSARGSIGASAVILSTELELACCCASFAVRKALCREHNYNRVYNIFHHVPLDLLIPVHESHFHIY